LRLNLKVYSKRLFKNLYDEREFLDVNRLQKMRAKKKLHRSLKRPGKYAKVIAVPTGHVQRLIRLDWRGRLSTWKVLFGSRFLRYLFYKKTHLFIFTHRLKVQNVRRRHKRNWMFHDRIKEYHPYAILSKSIPIRPKSIV
jgi:hypothetical protein